MGKKFCFLDRSPQETRRELERNWREVIAPTFKALMERIGKK